MNIQFLLSILLLFSIYGCSDTIEKVNPDKEAINKLFEKYPEFKKHNFEDYELYRTVITGEKKISIKLFLHKKEEIQENQIIVIQNENGKSFALPFFCNDLRNYWNFENEKKTYLNKSYNSVFEKELLLALKLLKLNDADGTGLNVILEIFHSLLHFQVLTEFDAAYIESLGFQLENSGMYSDSDEETQKRIELNSKQILEEIDLGNGNRCYNAFLDTKNNRVFQFDFMSLRKVKIKKFNIKVYRFGQSVIMTYL